LISQAKQQPEAEFQTTIGKAWVKAGKEVAVKNILHHIGTR
jgi:hypothetical protein